MLGLIGIGRNNEKAFVYDIIFMYYVYNLNIDLSLQSIKKNH